MKNRISAIIVLVVAVFIGAFVYSTEKPNSRFAFHLGLDLAGGAQLTYRADTSSLAPSDLADPLASLRDVIERRVNLFGVSEPVVQVERGSRLSDGAPEERLIVELPGVTDLDAAVEQIGKTPSLEFALRTTSGTTTGYTPTGLTGAFVKRASLEFGHGGSGGISNEPTVVLEFWSEGQKLFADITREHIGDVLAIFLDGVPISEPVIQDEIPDGRAIISGTFTPDEARELVRNLNFGALPVPIELVGTQSVGAALGDTLLGDGVRAGVWGILLVMLFLILWYRAPGLVGSVALAVYVLIMLALFKLIPVTLTAAGIAGFVLSVGMAVDANVLIFERIKDELRAGRALPDALSEGFARAWLPIRDGNVSSIITAIILFWLGTSLVEGFALVFAIGVLVSMLSAIFVTRIFLRAVAPHEPGSMARFLFNIPRT